MATTTTNFGWDIPQSTDLVKDGATAIAALGQDIDTAMVDLKGGTTGQVLAKASGTDLDFSWVAQDDSNAIQNDIVDAKGDLIGATAADTPARLAVGTNGQVLTADSSASTGLAWSTVSAGAFTKISSGTFSASAAVNIDSVFSATYRTYLLTLTSSNASANVYTTVRFRTSGSSNSTSNYKWQKTNVSGILIQTNSSSDTSGQFFESISGTDGYNECYFRNPFQTDTTHYFQKGDRGGQPIVDMNAGLFNDTTSFDGFSIICSSGNITGTWELYGLGL
jgi:hypothetical protein